MRKRRRRDKRRVVYLYAVEHLVALLQASQYAYRILDRRFIYHNGLETPRKSCILFDILSILVKRRRAYAVKLAARQHWLEQVARVHRTLCFTRAYNVVQLVDKQYYLPFRTLHLVEHGLQPLLKFAPEFRAGYKRAHVKRKYAALLQALRHVALHNALRQPFGYCRFAHAGLAYQDRVILGLS